LASARKDQRAVSAHLVHLADRGIVSVSGADAIGFLDKLVTADLARLATDPAVFAALLTPQGKMLFEFFVVRRDDGVWLETDRAAAPALVKRLTLYKLRANVTINDLGASHDVVAAWGGTPPALPLALTYHDTRAPGMGQRQILAAPQLEKLSHAFEPPSAYAAHRVARGVAQASHDYVLGDTFPHEANLDRDGVSFTKGCFIGQEVVARMQNKTVVRKRVVRVAGDGLATGGEIHHGAGVIGTIGTVAGRDALALVRLDRAVEAADKGQTLTSGGKPVTVDAKALDAYRTSLANRPVIDL
jgi:folate-binding protein YgfZ